MRLPLISLSVKSAPASCESKKLTSVSRQQQLPERAADEFLPGEVGLRPFEVGEQLVFEEIAIEKRVHLLARVSIGSSVLKYFR